MPRLAFLFCVAKPVVTSIKPCTLRRLPTQVHMAIVGQDALLCDCLYQNSKFDWPFATMESKDGLVPELILENSESGLKVVRIDDAEEPTDRDLIVHPFKRWVNSLRTKKGRRPCLEKYVEDWPTIDGNNLSPYQASQEQQWERLSGHSSQLGTVKTISMSIASQSVMRSRGATQSTTNHSGNSDSRTSADSLRPTLSPTIDEATHTRSIKRRQLLQEIVSTESDYVSGLKSLSNVC